MHNVQGTLHTPQLTTEMTATSALAELVLLLCLAKLLCYCHQLLYKFSRNALKTEPFLKQTNQFQSHQWALVSEKCSAAYLFLKTLPQEFFDVLAQNMYYH